MTELTNVKGSVLNPENFGLYQGSGTPEGVVTAPVGSIYLNDTGSTNTTLYVKESGTGNTGWVAAGTGAGGGTGDININTIIDNYTATQDQTVLDLNTEYLPSQNSIYVYINGVFQVGSLHYTETSSSQITFTEGLNAGDAITVLTGTIANYPVLYTTSESEIQVATASQTVFTLTTISYVPASENLSVYVNGIRIYPEDYVETDATTVTFNSGLTNGDKVQFLVNEIHGEVFTGTTSIVYSQGGTGSVTNTLTAKLQETVSVMDFGAVGDYTTDDTAAIDAALATGKAVYFPEGVYRYTGTLNLSDRTIIRGAGNPKIASFPQYGGDKDLLRPGYKNQISGSCIIFDGSGTTTPQTTIRSDKFASITPMLSYVGNTGISISDIGLIQDMDVRDSGGSLTTGSTDNKASAYTSGIFLENTTLSSFTNVTLFGYFNNAGLIIYAGEDSPTSLNPDYNTFINCLITGGTAILSHDAAAGATTTVANTGNNFVACGMYAADHHTRLDGDYSIPTIYIDGYIGGSIGKIRGHRFTSCNVRTYANDSIILDHADDIQFASCVWEFPSLSGGGSDSDASGGFVGTSNTGDLWIFGGAGTTQPKISDYLMQTGGKTVCAGGGEFDGFMVAEGSKGVRVAGNAATGDSYIQLTDDLSSTTSGWVINRDESGSDEFQLRYANTTKLRINTDGAVVSPFGLGAGSNRTIASGVISMPSNGNYFAVNTEGAASTDDLDTINGASFVGEIIILRAGLSTTDVVIKDGTGNIRCAGDFTLTHSQDRMMLIWDGTNWCELSRSDNTA